MADQFCCYHQLAAHKQKGVHYVIRQKYNASHVGVISPHGGGIERGVSELVRAVAGGQFSWYLFEGIQKKGKNFEELHVTSHHFDEPSGLEFVAAHQITLALHGYKGDDAKTYLGGRHQAAREHIGKRLRESDFEVPLWSMTPSRLRGLDAKNICNRCSDECGGIQLEITEGQRKRFFRDDFGKRANRRNTTDEFERYVAALQESLRDIEKWH